MPKIAIRKKTIQNVYVAMTNTSIINIKTPFGSPTKRYEAMRAGGFGRVTAEGDSWRRVKHNESNGDQSVHWCC